MKRALILFTIISTPYLISCHKKAMAGNESAAATTTTTTTTTTITSDKEVIIKKAKIDAGADMSSTGAAYKIDSMSVNGNILSVFVNYSGGCKDHSFEMVSNGMYAKSMPPQLSLCLQHTNNEDMCKKLVTQELKFDVSDLKYKTGNSVVLKIGDKKATYAY